MKSKSTPVQQTLSRPSSIAWSPHAYQKRAVKFLLEHAAAALFLDPGLGKTSITLAALKILKKKGLVGRVLLVAPLRVCHSVWPAELEKWTDFHGLKIVVLHGRFKDELLREEADVYVVNPEGLEWLADAKKITTPSGKKRVEVDLRRWKAFGFDALVVDELSKFKHHGSMRFKIMKLLLHTFGRRWGLTGSPAANGLMDLFSQMYMLDQGRSLGPYITSFRRQYFNPGRDLFSWVLREGADEEIYERIRPLTLRMAAEDYLEMPKVIENNIRVDLPEDAMRVYLALENDLVARIDAGKVTAATASAASMKCSQVANGGIYLDQEVEALVKLPKSKREWVDLHEVKVDAVEELVEELQGSPLLVAYDFNHDLARLQQRFKGAPYIGSGVSAKEMAAIEREWNLGKVPLLLAHPQSAAHGLNLQASGCHHVAWHSLTWDFELYDQFIRRVRRQGAKAGTVFVHHLVARGTVDEEKLLTLKSKDRGQQAMFKALKSIRSRK